ncbi:MAG: helix-turn-helix domain-containing protein [Actinomycetes bacterium]
MSGIAGRPRLLDVSEAAEYLRMNQRWVRRAIQEGRLPFIKLGGLIRFSEDDLREYLLANRRLPVGAPKPRGRA